MKVSDKARAKIARHQRLMEIKHEYGLSKFFLYKSKKEVKYIISRSEWLGVKDRSLIPITDPEQFCIFLRVIPPYNRFVFDEQPERYYTNIQDFIEEYLIIKLARI